MKHTHIPDDLYKKFRKHMPVVCVDAVIVSGGKCLLGKRTNVPAQGEWFVPGGRVYKGELVSDAIVRKIKEELGIEVDPDDMKLLTIGNTFYSQEEDGEERHDVCIAYIYKNDGLTEENILFDTDQMSEVQWFEKINPNWHPYVKKCLLKAGFAEKM